MGNSIAKNTLVVLLLFIFGQSLFSQINSKIRFTTINNTDGLPNNTVNTIVKDDLGFVWIGTNDGLCRYESSNHLKIFRANNPETPNGLQSSNIRSLYLDSKHNLWIGTRLGGLTRFHQPSNTWKTFRHDEDNPSSISNDEILTITEDRKGRIWVGTENGLNVYNSVTEIFTSYKVNKKDPNALQGKAVLSIIEDDKGWMWIGTWAGGLNLMTLPEGEDLTRAQFRNFIPNNKNESQHIWSILQDNQKRYWIGSRGAGLFLMQLPTNANNTITNEEWEPNFHNYTYDKNSTTGICNNHFQTIYQDSKDNLWIGTVNGLNHILAQDLPDSSFLQVTSIKPEFKSQQYVFDPADQTSLTNNDISSIFEDNQGILWFGTYSGVSQYNWYTNQFDVHELLDDLSKTPNTQNLYVDPDGIAWIGNGEKGLLNYNFEKEQIFQYKNNSSLLKGAEITSLYSPDNITLFIGSNLGISKLNLKTNQIQNYSIPPLIQKQFIYFVIRTLFKDSHNRIWVGTEQGLFVIDEKDGSFESITHNPSDSNSISDNAINQIYEDSNGDIWIATYQGLNRLIDVQSKKFSFEIFKHDSANPEISLPSNRETALIESNGILYIGSNGGICGYDLKKKTFTNYSKDNHKYSIQSFEKTMDGNLWASTSDGIIFFNTQAKTFNFYEKRDGLGDITFRARSSFSGQDGYIYFGSRRGITRFKPKDIALNSTPSPIHITSIRTMSSDSEKIINGTYQKEMILEHNDFYISLDYASINYNRPEKNKYAFMLEGFDDNWTYINNNTPAVYTNLKHGIYTFRVKAANNDGVWNEVGTALKVIKKPAFWETCWFFIGTFLFVSILLWLGIRAYTKSIYQRNQTLQKYNKTLNNEIANRKLVEKALQEREQHMESLVKQRTEELEIKNKEVQSLLQNIKERNEHLEIEIAKRTQNLQESNEDLQRSNKDLEQFAYIASHDLQEPLRIVGNFIGLLGRQYKQHLDDRAFQYIDFAVDGVSRMSQLITNLLTYSRVGRKEIEFQKTNLNKIIAEKIHDLSQKINERNVELKVTKMPEIICEQNQIGMVFFNLINNAIKFNKNESPQVIVSYHDESDDHWKFSVKDNGIGIDLKYQKQIFEIFRRLHNKQDYEGTGIGLAFCKKIIHRHGGKIWLDSKLGEGATFYFTISKKLKNDTAIIHDQSNSDLLKEIYN